MNEEDRSKQASAILDAIRAKREKRTAHIEDIDALEASLIEDIEKFDLDAMERQARLEAQRGQEMHDPKLVFPKITTAGERRHTPRETPPPTIATAPAAAAADSTPLLDLLRRQVESRQQAQQQASAERAVHSEAIDKALRHVFFYLHELTQQLDIIKPEIPRSYPLVDTLEFSGLTWQQGFADYRTQPQSAGALIEQVSFSYQLAGSGKLFAEREGPAAERFRAQLFDFGLQFECKEHRSERGYLERAEFAIPCELAVNLRWRADYHQGLILLEAHNFERLGSAVYPIKPASVDHALLDAFGRLALGQPNRFRELARRQ